MPPLVIHLARDACVVLETALWGAAGGGAEQLAHLTQE